LIVSDTGQAEEIIKFLFRIKDYSFSDEIIRILNKLIVSDTGLADELLNALTKVVIKDNIEEQEMIDILNRLTIDDSGLSKERLKARWDKWLCQTYKDKPSPYKQC